MNTGEESSVAEALLDAARAGKEVTAVVELRARFDEAANIDLATRLQAVGAKVAYGIVGYKTHAKLLLIIRREGGELRRYAHLGMRDTRDMRLDTLCLAHLPETGDTMLADKRTVQPRRETL